jgi:hypothetical protein
VFGNLSETGRVLDALDIPAAPHHS